MIEEDDTAVPPDIRLVGLKVLTSASQALEKLGQATKDEIYKWWVDNVPLGTQVERLIVAQASTETSPTVYLNGVCTLWARDPKYPHVATVKSFDRDSNDWIFETVGYLAMTPCFDLPVEHVPPHSPGEPAHTPESWRLENQHRELQQAVTAAQSQLIDNLGMPSALRDAERALREWWCGNVLPGTPVWLPVSEGPSPLDCVYLGTITPYNSVQVRLNGSGAVEYRVVPLGSLVPRFHEPRQEGPGVMGVQ